jgi:HTH-type transcriptional regulator / antitoxin HigA
MKKIKPIGSERDHARAMKEIEKLLGAKNGAVKGDRLDALAIVIEAWETVNYPIDPAQSSEVSRFRKGQQGFTSYDLAGIGGNSNSFIERARLEQRR